MNGLTLGGTGPGPGSASNATVNITGFMLQFTSNGLANPVLNLDANHTASGSNLTYNVSNYLGIGSTTLLIQGSGNGAFNLNNTLDGSGDLIKSGSCAVSLAASNTLGGTVWVNQGELGVRHPTALGSTNQPTVVAGGWVCFQSGAQTGPMPEPFTVSGGGGGGGALRATNNLTYTLVGDIQLATDALLLRSFSNASFVVTGGIFGTNSVAVQVDGAGPATILGGPIDLGPGSFTKTGAGQVVLTNLGNSWWGGTTIGGGTLMVGNGGTNGSLGSGLINNYGWLVFNSGRNLTLTNPMIGSGGFIKQGNGTLTLAAANTHGGTNRLLSGTLVLAEINALSTNLLELSGGATLRSVDATDRALANPLYFSGSVTFGAAGTGDLFCNGPWANLGTGSRTLTVLNNNVIIANAITNTAALYKSGPGALVLTSTNNSYSGSTIVTNGTLSIGDGGPNGSPGSGPITNNATLVFNSSRDLLVTNRIAGGGSLEKRGTSTLTLATTNSCTGVTRVQAGTLKLDTNSSVAASSEISIEDSAVLDVSTLPAGLAVPLAQTLRGPGMVNGSVILYGTNQGSIAITGTLEQKGVAVTVLRVTNTGPALICENITCGGLMTFNGTLHLELAGAPLGSCHALKLFDAPNYTGAFLTLDPARPGPDVQWDVSTLAIDGTLRVKTTLPASPQLAVSTLPGNPPLLQMTGFPTNSVVLTARDVTGPWHAVAFGSNSVTVLPWLSANPRQFYRAWVPTLDNPWIERMEPSVFSPGETIHVFGGPFSPCSTIQVSYDSVTNVWPLTNLFTLTNRITITLPIPFLGTITVTVNPTNQPAGTNQTQTAESVSQEEKEKEAPPAKPPGAPSTTPDTPSAGSSANNPTDKVQLFSGESLDEFTDMHASGVGLHFIWQRTYCSRSRTNSVQGCGWDFSYNLFARQSGDDVIVSSGNGRSDTFRLQPGGTYTRREFFQEGSFDTNGEFVLRFRDNGTWRFHAFDGGAHEGRIRESRDRNGNALAFTYDAQGRLTHVTDTVGRDFAVAYNPAGFIESVTDFAGRRVAYAYYQDGDADGAAGDLKSVTGPMTNITTYTYSKGYAVGSTNEALNHNLLTITDANGQTYLRNTYGTNPASADFDRVIRQSWGDSNDVLTLTYLPQVPDYANSFATMRNIVNDRMGNVTESFFDARNRCVIQRVFAGRSVPGVPVTDTENRPTSKLDPSDPDYWETRWEWNDDSLPTRTTHPDGTATEGFYEAAFSSAAPPRSRGNLRARCDWPGSQPSDQTVLAQQFDYDADNRPTRKTDTLGRATTYQYDADGNLLRETDPLGFSRAWSYDARGQILTETDKRGFDTRHYYNQFGQRTNTTDALSNVTTFAYDSLGNLLSKTDAKGRTTTYAYDLLNRLLTQTDPLGGTKWFAYDAIGNLLSVTDRNTNSTGFTYGPLGRLLYRTNALGGISARGHDRNGDLISTTDENGAVTTYAYNTQRRLIHTTNALGGVESLAYDAAGNLVSESDAGTNSTRHAYDAWKRRLATTNALGCVTRFAYTGAASCCGGASASQVSKVTDASGKVTYFKYDALDRRTQVIRKQFDTADTIDADDAVTTYTYDPNNNLLFVVKPNGTWTAHTYDALNRPVCTINSAGDTTLTSYDAVGNVLVVTAPNGNTTTNTYDALDRLVQVDDAIGRVASFTYDPEGRMLTQRDGNNNGPTFAYDALGRRVRVTDALGQAGTLEYNAVGSLVRFTGPEGRVTLNAFDALRRRTNTTDALGNVTTYGYDTVGNQVAFTDANGRTSRREFDAANRLVKESFPDAPPNTRTFTYDCVGNRTSRTDQNGKTTVYRYNDLHFLTQRDYPTDADDNFTYDLAGRMLTAEKGGWWVTLSYDGANRITNTTQGGRSIGRVYNTPARTRTLTYPGGRVVAETSDARGRLVSVNDGGSPALCNYTYDAANRVQSRAYRNGTVARFDYDPDDQLASLVHSNASGLIAGFAYGYDRDGNKLCEADLWQPARSTAYDHDAVHRLTNYAIGNLLNCAVPAPTETQEWLLDALGNWPVWTSNGVAQVRIHNEANEITAINAQALQHDANGNLTNDGCHAYTYDEENRLVQVVRLGTLPGDPRVVAQYAYDALGRRIAKLADPDPLSPPSAVIYLHDNVRTIEEQTPAGATLATYTYGNYVDEVLTMDRGGAIWFYHHNGQASPVAITSATGQPMERYAYDPYGQVHILDGLGVPLASNCWGTAHSSLGNPVTFTGREHDEETGLLFYRARSYDTLQGRFLQRDPLGYVDGFNLYEYVRSNPGDARDPFGLSAEEAKASGHGHTERSIDFTLHHDIPKGGVTIPLGPIPLVIKWGGEVTIGVKGNAIEHCCGDGRDAEIVTISYEATGSIGVSATAGIDDDVEFLGLTVSVWAGIRGEAQATLAGTASLSEDRCNSSGSVAFEISGTVSGTLRVGGEVKSSGWWSRTLAGVEGNGTLGASAKATFECSEKCQFKGAEVFDWEAHVGWRFCIFGACFSKSYGK